MSSLYVTVWAAMGVALWHPTCFYLCIQDGLGTERQQADEVAHRAVGLLSKVFPQLQCIVTGNKLQKIKIKLQLEGCQRPAGLNATTAPKDIKPSE